LTRKESDISTVQTETEQTLTQPSEPEKPVVKKNILEDLVGDNQHDGTTEMTRPEQAEDSENA